MSIEKHSDADKTPNLQPTNTPQQNRYGLNEKVAASSGLQRLRAKPKAVTPGNILALQRTVGNQAVRQLLRQVVQPSPSPTSTEATPVIQRVEAANPLAVAEEEWKIVAGGQKIKYTALAAGCLAVTVFFEGGGAAGVHLAMLPTNANQFGEFLAAIAGRRITRAFLDCDMLGDGDGWKIKYDVEELGPDLNTLPRSAADLTRTLTTQQQLDNGWISDQGLVTDWFKQKLGVNPTTSKNQNPEYPAPAAPVAAAAPAPALVAAPAPAVTLSSNKDEKGKG